MLHLIPCHYSYPMMAALQLEHHLPALLESRQSLWAWQQRLVYDMAPSLFLSIRQW